MYLFSIAAAIDLAQAETVFASRPERSGSEYLCLGCAHLDSFLGTLNGQRKMYLFRSGCAVFQDFSEEELQMTLKFLDANLVEISYQYIVQYREALRLETLGQEWAGDYRRLEATVPFYLSKSVELHMLEDAVNEYLACEKTMIKRLRNAKHRLNLRYTSNIRRQLILLQCRALNHANLLGNKVRIISNGNAALCAKLDDTLALTVRTRAFQIKIEHINDLLARFSHEKMAATMIHFYIYEIYLLAIFPLLHFIPNSLSVAQAYSGIAGWLQSLFH